MKPLLELKNVTKIYPGGVLANHNVNFSVMEGEIHALVGENGAGKSTLMKILFGMEDITSGGIYLRGNELKLNSSKDAIEHGIGMVHQHFMLVDSFTGAENMMLGLKNTSFVTNMKHDVTETDKISKKYGFDIDARKCVRDMSVGMKQKLEILKILYRGATIIILDEPTAVLTPQETEELFEQLMELKKHGMTIIFISHKLDEVKRISDRVTILKAGMTKGTYETTGISKEEISSLMIGRTISLNYDKPKTNVSQELLRVEELVYVDRFGISKLNGASLSVYDSEIVGIAGVEGNGQAELVSIITANARCASGRIIFKGKEITHASIGQIRTSGMSYVPEDRMFNGCAASMSIEENMIISNVDNFAGKAKILDEKKIEAHSRQLINEFNVKARNEKVVIKALSGGNIQKAIVAREFSAGSDLLILDQPTRGVDVGALSFIHQKILELRTEGKGILLVSADLNELIALSDRILVMYKGETVASIDNSDKISEQELGLYMLGLKKQKEAV